MLFRTDVILILHWSLPLGLLFVASLASESLSFIDVAYERENLLFSLIFTCSLHNGLSFCISILLWYKVDKVFECIEDSLELLLLKKTNLPLRISMSISISMLKEFWVFKEDGKCLVVLRNNIFTNSLINTTIQDSGKRERSNVAYHLYCVE